MVNKTLADAFGVTKEWLLGKLDHDYFPQEQADSFVAIDTEILETKKLKIFEEVARANGVDRIYATRKLPLLDDSGEARYVLGITEDITERKAAEEALRRSKAELEEANKRLAENLEELKRSRAVSARTLASYQQRALQMEIIRQQNEDLDRLATELAIAKRNEEERAREAEAAARLKSEFLANFSHEIRTPLNGIIGYCDLLMREEGSRLTPHGRRDLNVVKKNAQTLLALINDILDLSKIEAGRVDLVVERVDMQELVEECMATVQEYLKGKDVELRTDIDERVAYVRTDALKLRQILLNLLSNAAKFTESGEVSLTARAEGNEAVFIVEDTGIGIPAGSAPLHLREVPPGGRLHHAQGGRHRAGAGHRPGAEQGARRRRGGAEHPGPRHHLHRAAGRPPRGGRAGRLARAGQAGGPRRPWARRSRRCRAAPCWWWMTIRSCST